MLLSTLGLLYFNDAGYAAIMTFTLMQQNMVQAVLRNESGYREKGDARRVTCNGLTSMCLYEISSSYTKSESLAQVKVGLSHVLDYS